MEHLFVELTAFTRKVVRLDLEDDLRALEDHLRENPTAGMIDPGTCGLRKIRMAVVKRRKGKRFGARVHYLYDAPHRTIFFFNLYLKEEQSTLTSAQKKMLCALVDQLTEQ
ncbi:MAG TPA: hypothetical protein VLK84_29655 [Longimicrobium sp.]|nr:hypothetical protein [Longimicrobium sp.]